MGIAQQIDEFFQKTGQEVFIEAEGKENRIRRFIEDYNSKTGEIVNSFDEGIIVLENDADKWGLELRCYFQDKVGFPEGVKITSNRVYRSEYPFRFNDVKVINQLFELGYRIGAN